MCRLLHYCISRQWSIQEHDECDRNVRIENREANIRVSPTDQSSATVPLGVFCFSLAAYLAELLDSPFRFFV